MFRQVFKTNWCVHIQYKADHRIFPIHQFERARTQDSSQIRIRKPIRVIIDGNLFIFKKNQWVKAGIRASDYKRFCGGLPDLYRYEQWNRFEKQIPLRKK